jgi:hypothetical protein
VYRQAKNVRSAVGETKSTQLIKKMELELAYEDDEYGCGYKCHRKFGALSFYLTRWDDGVRIEPGKRYEWLPQSECNATEQTCLSWNEYQLTADFKKHYASIPIYPNDDDLPLVTFAEMKIDNDDNDW